MSTSNLMFGLLTSFMTSSAAKCISKRTTYLCNSAFCILMQDPDHSMQIRTDPSKLVTQIFVWMQEYCPYLVGSCWGNIRAWCWGAQWLQRCQQILRHLRPASSCLCTTLSSLDGHLTLRQPWYAAWKFTKLFDLITKHLRFFAQEFFF